MSISIITICNKKDDNLKKLIEKYIIHVRNFHKLKLIDVSFGKHSADKKKYSLESEKALTYLKPNSILIALDEKGELFDSIQFSKKLSFWIDNFPEIFFIIGGPDGLPDIVKTRANNVISLSRLTYPHLLAKVLLTEQIYRALCIINNHPYHRI